MDNYKQPLNDSLISRSACITKNKLHNTKQFLNRFNQLHNYNAIHSQNHRQSQHLPHHSKSCTLQEKTSPNKLKLSHSKNHKTKANLSSSRGQKSERKMRILNDLTNKRHTSKVNQKYQQNTKKIVSQKRQTIPSGHQVFKKYKIKANIERLSLKINCNYHPPNTYDFIHKKNQRFSFNPSGNPYDHNLRIQSVKTRQMRENRQMGENREMRGMRQMRENKGVRDLYEPKMRRSLVKLKCGVLDDNEEKNMRHSKITQNWFDSIKNERVRQIKSDCPNIKLKSDSKLNIDRKQTWAKQRQFGSQSMKHLLVKQNKQELGTNQKVNNKGQIEQLKTLNIKRTDLKQSDKQNYQQKMNALTKSSYIRNFVKTSNLQTQGSQKKYRNESKRDTGRLYLAPGMNQIQLLHPEGEFPAYFESQFKPW